MNEFIVHLTELFTDFGPIRSRRMFGGYGIYHNELMFGLVADDVLFLKTDKALAHEMSEMGLEPFRFQKGDTLVTTSYYEAPPSIYDDDDDATRWAQRAYAAAIAAKGAGNR